MTVSLHPFRTVCEVGEARENMRKKKKKSGGGKREGEKVVFDSVLAPY